MLLPIKNPFTGDSRAATRKKRVFAVMGDPVRPWAAQIRALARVSRPQETGTLSLGAFEGATPRIRRFVGRRSACVIADFGESVCRTGTDFEL